MLLLTLALAGMIAMSLASFFMPLNGRTTGEIAERLPVLFMPAGYALLIWIVIYLLLVRWAAFYWKNASGKGRPSRRVSFLFIASGFFHISWLAAWHYGHFLLALVLAAGYLLALACLYFQYGPGSRQRVPISVIFGWVTAIFISNTAYVLTYYSWSGWGISDALWTVIMMTIAAAAALHVRFHYADIAYPVVFIWLFIGIAVKNGFNEMLVSVASLFLSGVLLVGIFFIKKRPA
ncbi:tryptophan-rich sensory protein [Indiicoccus explosivorum]|uniref:tryptophan-rich sensory protein n=1 Tax=Indiicoccus explosivorum TaxID=1917864 RepID=UPI0030C66280